MPLASVVEFLAPLAILACPVGMGLMMWMMGRQSKATPAGAKPEASSRPASVEVLREEHRRLGAELERLEGSRDAEAGRR